ncbi:hypothetical protein IMZ31_22110 (plasmid) [Pontibacillus sp. ALD_SL1]|uniref:hypothetical protein n=1 Tax=Pontibacillus sp. ALD_SL1 TaxID=2777185 RepID=UPI001A96F266|nr:hypothetical protein [Pontibacillus sp. ALD_SL1]QST02149.1 hypothetical protein IMZ31_22110 [Pontibacillus sp. ALD_SL1]
MEYHKDQMYECFQPVSVDLYRMEQRLKRRELENLPHYFSHVKTMLEKLPKDLLRSQVYQKKYEKLQKAYEQLVS